VLLDAVVSWLASAGIRQARAGRPLPMLRVGACALLGLTVTARPASVTAAPTTPQQRDGDDLDAYIHEMIASPPLTSEQRDMLALLLHPRRRTR